MSSAATEATSSLHHDPQLAVRLSSAPPQHTTPQNSQNDFSNEDQQPEIPIPARRRPKRPAIPRHPIPSMQEAFAESLAEVTSGTLSMKPKLHVDTPQIRRDRLLDQDKSEPAPESLWRMRPAQNCHELRKLLAQIAFGVYLLLKGMANSDAQVVAILQGHIDEVDDFLKTAMEDLKLATQDLNTRLDYLKLPLGNLPAFEEMLEDREFRLRIVEGNVRIEHILSRTTTALAQTIDDVSEGLCSTKEFITYLSAEEHGAWRAERPAEVIDIFEAMRGNAEGWLNAFADLEEKTNTLDLLISKLADMVTEMDRCAGEVSRRTRFSIKPFTLPELTSRLSQDSQDSQDSSFQSFEATPPHSPSSHVPQMPPRLSIRFSAMGDILEPTTFFDRNNRNTPLSTEQLLPSLQYTPPAEVLEQKVASEIHTTLRPTQYTPEPTRKRSVSTAPTSPRLSTKDAEVATIKSHTTAIRDADSAVDSTVESDDMPISLYFDVDTANEDSFEAEVWDSADTPTGPIQAQHDEKKDNGETLFLLQPRTYTPQTSPSPSPRVVETSRRAPSREVLLPPRAREGGASPRLVIPSTESRRSSKSPTSPMSSVSHNGSFSTVRETSAAVSPADSVSSERTLDSDFISGIPQKRTSIRERVSLRTTPPDAIQVPSPNAPQLQRPVYTAPQAYQNHRAFTGSDSACSSENDRMTVIFHEATPIASPSYPPMTTSSHGYSPPSFPNVVPSPHSEQQYFRPVQASPYSPLQQRPHTAGQVLTRPHHLRNVPSSMGMSMLSNMTTMTQNTKGQAVVKKKRSAFGWLKKAFTLDDDERLAYEQRKHADERNLYYDTRSPKFLDGKRIR